MKKVKTHPWDVAFHLQTPEEVAAYLEAAIEEGDPQLIAAAMGDAESEHRAVAQILQPAILAIALLPTAAWRTALREECRFRLPSGGDVLRDRPPPFCEF